MVSRLEWAFENGLDPNGQLAGMGIWKRFKYKWSVDWTFENGLNTNGQ